ncbi:glucan endo-1,3-beta-glucosidase-like [Vitis riparia]|uniref:glucan endo-1,3-beta-glucosidase-like n=1 Tax=Vitis riparia TaxID=96939 RepID=UPI00155A8E9A|nr:glucan endo-1,3-beta-glucosidase-like [Vitis riparia]
MAAKLPSLLLLLVLFHNLSAVYSIGVNYGTVADNLASPSEVAAFIKDKTIFDRVKIFDTNPDIINAFANTGIGLTVTVVNLDIPKLLHPNEATNWVATNIVPFYQKTKINYICVGNEITMSGISDLIVNLVPAMKAIHAALQAAGINDIKVTTPHPFSIMASSSPPSSGKFAMEFEQSLLIPMLQFHRETNSPFTVNPYPYFAYSGDLRNFLLFGENEGAHDQATGLTYTNMFDAMVDSVYSAMKSAGFGDVSLVVGETGWSSVGDPGRGIGMEEAKLYNANLIKHITSGKGTPLMPGKPLETYIFALFNENQKPGPSEQNFGLLKPDFSPVYESGCLRGGQQEQEFETAQPLEGEKTWCVPKRGAPIASLQLNLDFACATGVDCTAIQKGGDCSIPYSVWSHASYAMNSYYQSHGRTMESCDFKNTGRVTTINPSYAQCIYLS